MAEELLDRADVVSALEKVGGETMPEGVTTGGFGDAGCGEGEFHCVLEVFLRDVVAAGLSATRIEGEFGRGEDVLPRPGTGGPGVFAVEGEGEMDGSEAAGEIALVELADAGEMGLERCVQTDRQEGDSLAHAFAFADADLVVAEIDVFDPEAQDFEEAEATAVEEVDHEPIIPFELGKDGPDFGAGKDDRKLRRAPDAFHAGEVLELPLEDLPIKEEEGAEGLILGGGGDAAVDGEVTEEGGNLRFAQLLGVAFAMEEDEAANPIEIRLLGADAVVFDAQMPTDTIEQL